MTLPGGNLKILFPVSRYRDRYVKTKKGWGVGEQESFHSHGPFSSSGGPWGDPIGTVALNVLGARDGYTSREHRTDTGSLGLRVQASSG